MVLNHQVHFMIIITMITIMENYLILMVFCSEIFIITKRLY